MVVPSLAGMHETLPSSLVAVLTWSLKFHFTSIATVPQELAEGLDILPHGVVRLLGKHVKGFSKLLFSVQIMI